MFHIVGSDGPAGLYNTSVEMMVTAAFGLMSCFCDVDFSYLWRLQEVTSFVDPYRPWCSWIAHSLTWSWIRVATARVNLLCVHMRPLSCLGVCIHSAWAIFSSPSLVKDSCLLILSLIQLNLVLYRTTPNLCQLREFLYVEPWLSIYSQILNMIWWKHR